MEVSGIELAHLFQPLPVQHPQDGPLQGDQALAPQVLEDPVDVHRRDPQRIAQFRLRRGQLEGIVLDQPNRPHAHQQLADEMRKMALGRAAPHAHHPLPEHRRVDERLAPEQVTKARVAADQATQVVMLDEGQRAGDQGRQAVVHHVQV